MDTTTQLRSKFLILLSMIFGLGLTTHAMAAEVKGHNLYDVSYYYGPGGTFVNVGSGKWVEKNRDGTFHFDETGRDEWSVYIKRGSVRVKLDMWKKSVDLLRNGSWITLYNIRNANAMRHANENAVVTLFQHGGYGGYKVKLPLGNFKLKDLERRGMRNDDISSFKIPPGYEVTMYEDDHFSTALSVFGIPVGGWHDTYRGNTSFIGHHRNDEISSVRVKKISPKSSLWYLDCDGFYGYFELLAQDYPITDECD